MGSISFIESETDSMQSWDFSKPRNRVLVVADVSVSGR